MQTTITEVKRAEAKREIKLSLKWGNFCTRMVGVDFYEEDWHPTLYRFLVTKARFFISTLAILWIGLGEFGFIVMTITQASRIDEVVVLIHLWAYVLLSISKMVAIWSKRDGLKKLLTDLEQIWPSSPLSSDETAIKEKSLASLSIMHSWYFWLNLIGVCSYILTPAVIHLYQKLYGQSEELGLPWMILYPYDIHAPTIKAFTYAWEAVMGLLAFQYFCGIRRDFEKKIRVTKIMVTGFVAVFTMVGPDLLVTALASHVCMLMRLLNLRLRSLASAPDTVRHNTHHPRPADHFGQVVECIKLHQKLIGYCQDIEDAFSFAFLVNIVLSSVNICCSGFICVLLEPLMNPSNKVYLVSSLYQIGLLCWYGDDIYQVSGEVSEAAYAGGWYRCDSRSRNALRFLMQRSQKRLTFTAMRFKYINLVTYTSILTTSYSYFTLLSTMYSD